jgi:hypothetical protein
MAVQLEKVPGIDTVELQHCPKRPDTGAPAEIRVDSRRNEAVNFTLD